LRKKHLLTESVMLKLLHKMAALPAILMPFMDQSAFSLPPTRNSQDSVVQRETNKPVCYMETTDGRTLNLSSMCGSNNQKNPQQRQGQRTDQLCNDQDDCSEGFNSSESLSSGVRIYRGSP
jgi:hypothetical protein